VSNKNDKNNNNNNNNKVKSQNSNEKISRMKIHQILEIIKKVRKVGVKFEVNDFSRGLVGIPPKIKVKLRYSDFTTHTHSAGVFQTWVFRGNSVYDPDFTYSGHQPVGFDELAAFYMYYYVHGSKIHVSTSSLTALVPQTIIIKAVRELVAPTSWVPLVEGTRAEYRMVPTSGIPETNLHMQSTTKEMFEGQGPLDQDFGALVTTNPAKVWYWEVWTQSSDQGTTAILAVQPVVEYEVVFSQKQVLDVS